jgi:hypothetical protein
MVLVRCLSPLYMGCRRGVQNLKPIRTKIRLGSRKEKDLTRGQESKLGFHYGPTPTCFEVAMVAFVFRDMKYNATSLGYVFQRMALTLSCKGLLVYIYQWISPITY